MIKYKLYKYLQILSAHLLLFAKSLSSIVAVLVFSKFKIKLPTKHNAELVVLGNGHSLKSLYSNQTSFISNKDTLATNDFARTSLFFDIKPTMYVLADPAFFSNNIPLTIANRKREIFDNLNKSHWNIILFVPFKYKLHVSNLITNKHIRLYFFNHAPCSGYYCVLNVLFKKKLGMPYVKNVLIAALIIGIQMNYKNIYLWGVDHDWMKHMVLNKDGVLCLESHHFYSDENQEPKIWHKEGETPWKVAEALFSMSQMFKGYYMVSEFAKSQSVSIFNNTPNSMIDAFPFVLIKTKTE